jgi:TRAP-type C4-dicarboxylate transport system permease small subunit
VQCNMIKKIASAIMSVSALFVFLLFVLVVAQVVLRYGFGYTSLFTEEIARYLLVWAVMLGAAEAVLSGDHLRVDFLVGYLNKKARFLWLIFLEFVSFSLFAMLLFTGFKSAIFLHGQESSGLQIPLSFPYLAIPLFALLACIFALDRLRRFREIAK